MTKEVGEGTDEALALMLKSIIPRNCVLGFCSETKRHNWRTMKTETEFSKDFGL